MKPLPSNGYIFQSSYHSLLLSLTVSGQTYDSSYLRENIQLEAESRQLDTGYESRGRKSRNGENRARHHGQRIMPWQQFRVGVLPQGRRCHVAKEVNWTRYCVTCSPSAGSAETNDDVNSTMQTNREQCNLTSWLTKTAEPAGRKGKDNRPRSGSTQGPDDVAGLLMMGLF
jgi:hypothetical protein